MISVTTSGNSNKTVNALQKILRGEIFRELDRYGKEGVAALSKVTPVDSGFTAGSWYYRIIKNRNQVGIEWYNTNKVNGTPLVILLVYGHATGNGGYVQGRNFINPTMKPIFDKIADEIWKKVKNG